MHAKVCVIDDVWVSVGSDNFNRRSWTHDSELSNGVLDATRDEREPRDPAGLGDGARVFARDLRLELWREHLGRASDGSEDDELLDPVEAVAAFERTALRARRLVRRRHGRSASTRTCPPARPERLRPCSGLWAVPVYRGFLDPDGRPWRERLRGGW